MPSFSGREKESEGGWRKRRKGKGTEDIVHMFILGDQIILLLHLTGGKYEAQDVQMGYQISNIKVTQIQKEQYPKEIFRNLSYCKLRCSYCDLLFLLSVLWISGAFVPF